MSMASESPTLNAPEESRFHTDQEKQTSHTQRQQRDLRFASSSSADKFSGKEENDASWQRRKSSQHMDDPFGSDDSDGGEGIKYKTLHWWQASVIMIAETISLGILSLPSVLASIGFVAGAILVVGLGVMATYTGYVIGQFKMAHPWVHNMGDAGYVLFAPLGPRWAAFGREFLGAAQIIFMVFSMASHLLTWTICLNALTDSSTCTIVWSVVGLAIFWTLDLPRTMKKLSWLACCSFASIFSAVLLTMIAIGVQNPAKGSYNITQKVAFAEAFSSVTTLIFAYTGHVAFFSFISEMKEPKDFPKALIALQIFDVSMYLVAAVVIYYYAGNDVTSPALGSTGPLISKIAYGIAIPTIIIAGVILGHVASKLIYVRLFRGTTHMADKGLLSRGSWAWAAITLTLWTIAWIIAESIPNFNTLLALISSLFGSWFTYGISGIFWIFINRGRLFANWKKIALTVVNSAMIVIGAIICVVGMYASGVELGKSTGGSSWSCAGTNSG